MTGKLIQKVHTNSQFLLFITQVCACQMLWSPNEYL